MAIAAVLQAIPPAVLPVVPPAEAAVPAVVSLQEAAVDLPVAEAVSPAVPPVAVLSAAGGRRKLLRWLRKAQC